MRDHDALHKNTRSMDEVRLYLANFHKLLNFGNSNAPGSGHHGIKIPGGFTVHEITPAIPFPRLHEREVGTKSMLKDVLAAVEFACFFLLGDKRAVPGRRVEGGDTRAAGTNAFGKCALRVQFEIEFAIKHKLLEHLVFAHIAAYVFFNLAALEQYAETEFVHPGVITNGGEVLYALAIQGEDEVFGNSTESEASNHDAGAVLDIANGFVGRCHDFVHREELYKTEVGS